MSIQKRVGIEEIHPELEKFIMYVGKTKKTTTVSLRREIFENIPFKGYQETYSYDESIEIKNYLKTIDFKQILEEVRELDEKEKKRIRDWQNEAGKRKRIGKKINAALEEITPNILQEVKLQNNFFTKLKFKKAKIGFFVMDDSSKNGVITHNYMKKANKVQKMPTILNGEDENYFVTFFNPMDIAFMNGILSARAMNNSSEGFKIYGVPIQFIILNCQYESMEIGKIEFHEVKANDYLSSILKGVFAFGNRSKLKGYSHESIRIVIKELMKVTGLPSELHLACFLHFNYLLPMQQYVEKRTNYIDKNIPQDQKEYSEIKDKIFNQLVVDGVVLPKWRNEMDLFKIASKIYSTSVFQYRAEWLGKQSLDIMIPEINIAIEYQGIQHYEPIDFFGGQEAFLRRKQLDELKAEKCRLNGVNLIHWNYKETITKTNFVRILKDFMD